jgi:hypothetical protein
MKLADSGISLVYHSARAKDYLSTIQLQLTPDQIPESLLKVHIRITIEGVVYEKVFEADPNIRYTYAWDGLNEYRQVRVLKKLRFLKFRFSIRRPQTFDKIFPLIRSSNNKVQSKWKISSNWLDLLRKP